MCPVLYVFPHYIEIVREPSISCKKHHIRVGSVECTIHNYSQYVDIHVVKDDTKSVKTYLVHNVCKSIFSERADATCHINLNERGVYKICVNYTSSVENNSTLHRCSDSIRVCKSNLYYYIRLHIHPMPLSSGTVQML